MTREEAINMLYGMRADNLNFDDARTKDKYRALDMAIKELEQEPILDKIRAEIVDLGQRTMNDNRASGIWACVDIIDKYRAESEGKE